MSVVDWQLPKPMSAIAFDCDGTLSTIEGIDELAKIKGHALRVKELTQKAMAETGITPQIYETRLNLVLPKREDVVNIGYEYDKHQVPDVAEVIAILRRLQKAIYVVSAGLLLAVQFFAKQLRIQPDHVFAVDLNFDPQDQYIDFDHTSPLIHNQGKSIIVDQIKKKHHELVYVGDGLNDLSVKEMVTRFIGFGGYFYRENIAKQCQFYITTPSMAPLLPLVLTQNEFLLLLPPEKKLYEKGLQAILAGKV